MDHLLPHSPDLSFKLDLISIPSFRLELKGTRAGKHLASNWHFAKRLEELGGVLLSRPL
jgi:hypothetical protein